ncbi:MAG TPA: carboxypeptidase-like regulatory domain-containing protein [Gemmatimonadales bacterium]|nr:carboxypeptidase-like regulatory domain-containing protein [Gemmatimonadales bacterium]
MAIQNVIRTHCTKISIAAFCFSLLTTTARLQAQEVRGRLISAVDSTPVIQSLVLLLDDSGQERARTVTAPSGGFELHAPATGAYRLRVQRIGQRGWEAPAFQVVAGQITRMTLQVPDVPFQLGELEAVARRPRCGVMLGDASLSARVLEAAQTALGLAEAEATSRRRIYVTESYSRTVPEQGPIRDSMLVRGELTGWPIQSADPDSLRKHGFVQGEWPSGRLANPNTVVGPTYFAPDARVLFTDWFLAHTAWFWIPKPDVQARLKR